MAVLGLGVCVQSLGYERGTLGRMGPGFFPLALGIILTLTGVAIVAVAKPIIADGDGQVARPEWRGWICISLGILAFIVLGTHGGFVPATFAVVFISALGDRRNSLKSATILSLATVVVAVVVFSWGLKLQFPLFRWG
jgi:hypothetical protein